MWIWNFIVKSLNRVFKEVSLVSSIGATVFDTISIIKIAIIFIYSVLFGTSALDKIKSLAVPDWFIQQFSKTPLATFPFLIKGGYWMITLLESLLFIGFASSIIFPGFLIYSLLLSLFLFGILCFGLRISFDFQGSANMFTYFAATLVSIMAIR